MSIYIHIHVRILDIYEDELLNSRHYTQVSTCYYKWASRAFMLSPYWIVLLIPTLSFLYLLWYNEMNGNTQRCKQKDKRSAAKTNLNMHRNKGGLQITNSIPWKGYMLYLFKSYIQLLTSIFRWILHWLKNIFLQILVKISVKAHTHMHIAIC